MKKENFLLFYILISTSILFLAFKSSDSYIYRIIILGILGFFGIALKDHIIEVKSIINGQNSMRKIDYENLAIVFGTAISAAVTWYINHNLGFGPIVANGIVGVLVALIFSSKKAGAFYIASFIGMSGIGIVTSMAMAGLIGLFAGFVIIFSQEIYAGVGGKGGTIAALSTQLIRLILSLFI